MQFPPETVRELAQLLAESDLGELSFEAAKGQRLTIKRKPKFVGVAAPDAPAIATTELEIAAPTEDSAPSSDAGAILVASPCVGVFHAAKDAIEVGAVIKAKQLVGTVESLKVPNEIYAAEAGVVSQIWVSDGQGVEWGQPLFEIQPGPAPQTSESA